MNGAWPGGVSDGLTLPCQDCGVVPAVDWTCTDAAWAALDLPVSRGVLCLSDFVRRGGDVATVERVQVVGPGATAVFDLAFVHRYPIYPTASTEASS